jgi:hypothetical protein
LGIAPASALRTEGIKPWCGLPTIPDAGGSSLRYFRRRAERLELARRDEARFARLGRTARRTERTALRATRRTERAALRAAFRPERTVLRAALRPERAVLRAPRRPEEAAFLRGALFRPDARRFAAGRAGFAAAGLTAAVAVGLAAAAGFDAVAG